jgi:hypothetical protein
MNRQEEIWAGEAVIEAASQHRLRSGSPFLAWLANHDQRSLPSVFRLAEKRGSAEEGRHVDVVAACVHDGDFLTGVIPGFCGAGVG